MQCGLAQLSICSWRHTPFRNHNSVYSSVQLICEVLASLALLLGFVSCCTPRFIEQDRFGFGTFRTTITIACISQVEVPFATFIRLNNYFCGFSFHISYCAAFRKSDNFPRLTMRASRYIQLVHSHIVTKPISFPLRCNDERVVSLVVISAQAI